MSSEGIGHLGSCSILALNIITIHNPESFQRNLGDHCPLSHELVSDLNSAASVITLYITNAKPLSFGFRAYGGRSPNNRV